MKNNMIAKFTRLLMKNCYHFKVYFATTFSNDNSYTSIRFNTSRAVPVKLTYRLQRLEHPIAC